MAGIKRGRSESVELPGRVSSAGLLPGRPARRNAGRKSLPAGYLDPEEALRPMLQEDESESECAISDAEGNSHRPWTKSKKRQLSPARSLSPMPPIEDLPVDDQILPKTPEPDNSVSYTFNIPPNFKGPLVVNFDREFLEGLVSGTTSACQHNSLVSSWGRSSNLGSESSFASFGPSTAQPSTGFLDLPPELRNMIYRKVLVSKETVGLGNARNFPRTAAMLATCRQIHDEGAQILYGENKFELSRNMRVRGTFYESKWEEVGYKDCFRILYTIGHTNLSHIRHLIINCQDGPNRGPNPTDEKHRFVNDTYLISCLKLIVTHGQLQNLELGFWGRRMVKATDHRFVAHLLALRTDRLTFTQSRHRHAYRGWGWRTDSNMEDQLEKMIQTKAERKQKLY